MERYSRDHSGLNFRLLLPMLAGSTLLQMVVPLVRVATSYRAVELDLPVAQIGLLSSAFALLPVLFAVRIGRHNDRHGEGSTALLGAIVVGVAAFGLWLWSSDFISMLAFTSVLGIGQVMSISAHQMMTTRCSGPDQYDRVLGMFLVATACGQVLGPLIIGISTPAGSLYPDERLYWLVAGAAVFLLFCAIALKRGLPPQNVTSEAPTVNLGAILRTPGLPVIMLSSSMCLATNDLMLVFFPVLGAARGIDAATVGFLLSLRAVASMLSRLAFSRLVTRIGKLSLMILALVAAALATGLLAIDMSAWALACALAGSGFMMGLAVACSLSLTLAMAPDGSKATAMSLRLTASRFGQFILPLGAGMAASLLGPGSIFAMMGVALIACGSMLTGLRGRPPFI